MKRTIEVFQKVSLDLFMGVLFLFFKVLLTYLNDIYSSSLSTPEKHYFFKDGALNKAPKVILEYLLLYVVYIWRETAVYAFFNEVTSFTIKAHYV